MKHIQGSEHRERGYVRLTATKSVSLRAGVFIQRHRIPEAQSICKHPEIPGRHSGFNFHGQISVASTPPTVGGWVSKAVKERLFFCFLYLYCSIHNFHKLEPIS